MASPSAALSTVRKSGHRSACQMASSTRWPTSVPAPAGPSIRCGCSIRRATASSPTSISTAMASSGPKASLLQAVLVRNRAISLVFLIILVVLAWARSQVHTPHQHSVYIVNRVERAEIRAQNGLPNGIEYEVAGDGTVSSRSIDPVRWDDA